MNYERDPIMRNYDVYVPHVYAAHVYAAHVYAAHVYAAHFEQLQILVLKIGK